MRYCTNPAGSPFSCPALPRPLSFPLPPPPQVDNLSYFMPVSAGESVLSLLPPWHIYERSASYYVLSRGAKQVREGEQARVGQSGERSWGGGASPTQGLCGGQGEDGHCK